MGYGNSSAIEIIVSGASEPIELLACLNDGCIPAQVTANPDGRWLVPQEKPYFDGMDPATVTVEVRSSGQPMIATYDIPREGEGTGWFNHCPGPFDYLPVVVDVEGM